MKVCLYLVYLSGVFYCGPIEFVLYFCSLASAMLCIYICVLSECTVRVSRVCLQCSSNGLLNLHSALLYSLMSVILHIQQASVCIVFCIYFSGVA